MQYHNEFTYRYVRIKASDEDQRRCVFCFVTTIVSIADTKLAAHSQLYAFALRHASRPLVFVTNHLLFSKASLSSVPKLMRVQSPPAVRWSFICPISIVVAHCAIIINAYVASSPMLVFVPQRLTLALLVMGSYGFRVIECPPRSIVKADKA